SRSGFSHPACRAYVDHRSGERVSFHLKKCGHIGFRGLVLIPAKLSILRSKPRSRYAPKYQRYIRTGVPIGGERHNHGGSSKAIGACILAREVEMKRRCSLRFVIPRRKGWPALILTARQS